MCFDIVGPRYLRAMKTFVKNVSEIFCVRLLFFFFCLFHMENRTDEPVRGERCWSEHQKSSNKEFVWSLALYGNMDDTKKRKEKGLKFLRRGAGEENSLDRESQKRRSKY